MSTICDYAYLLALYSNLQRSFKPKVKYMRLVRIVLLLIKQKNGWQNHPFFRLLQYVLHKYTLPQQKVIVVIIRQFLIGDAVVDLSFLFCFLFNL